MQKHLNKEDRKTIDYCLKHLWSFTEIGKRIQRHKSVISREIKRNGGKENYRYGSAHKRYLYIRKQTKQHQKKIVKNTFLNKYIEKYLKKQYSPEQISGRIRLKEKIIISHETIYKWIYNERKDLQMYLRCQKGK